MFCFSMHTVVRFRWPCFSVRNQGLDKQHAVGYAKPSEITWTQSIVDNENGLCEIVFFETLM